SLVGATLVDCGFDTERVWGLFSRFFPTRVTAASVVTRPPTSLFFELTGKLGHGGKLVVEKCRKPGAGDKKEGEAEEEGKREGDMIGEGGDEEEWGEEEEGWRRKREMEWWRCKAVVGGREVAMAVKAHKSLVQSGSASGGVAWELQAREKRKAHHSNWY
ncbi:unnamed protein product, partial [Closterium sp. NIES-65]